MKASVCLLRKSRNVEENFEFVMFFMLFSDFC